MVPGSAASEAVHSDYSLYDHLERLRYLEVEAPAQETKLLRSVFQTALPGLEAFITDERHATLKGKMAYNAFGVVYNGGRDDKVGGPDAAYGSAHDNRFAPCSPR